MKKNRKQRILKNIKSIMKVYYKPGHQKMYKKKKNNNR